MAVAVAVGLVFYALSDILLWQRIFEDHDLFQFDAQYQSGHVTTLVALIGTGMILLYDAGLWALWYGLAFYTLAFSGLEDVLYYWLDGRAIPASLPWLNSNPLTLHPSTSVTLVVSAALWVSLWAASLALLPRLGRVFRRRASA